MNWKDNAHLFSNGKFKIKHGNFLDMPVRIEGIDGNHFIAERLSCNIKYCTLIARKIEDMTDEEHNHHQQIIYTVRNDVHGSVLFRGESIESFLYLLSIGVYPFDQSHFETGEVIDANK